MLQVWDLKSILGHFHSELSKIEQLMVKTSQNNLLNHMGDARKGFDLADIVANYKPAETSARPETTRLAFNR